jgi:hypothetical protein
MEYKRLIQLDNQYPNLRNYKSGSAENTDVLTGLYPETNKLTFELPNISDLKWIPNTKFRFILSISENTSSLSSSLYTSEEYYNDLISSNAENNPYFVTSSFNPIYIVNYYYGESLSYFDAMYNLETSSAVSMHKNIFIDASRSIDYNSLVSYIDWCVGSINPLDTISGGVLDPNTIGSWDYLNIDPLTGKPLASVSASNASKG